MPIFIYHKTNHMNNLYNRKSQSHLNHLKVKIYKSRGKLLHELGQCVPIIQKTLFLLAKFILSIPNILSLDLQKVHVLCLQGKFQSKQEFSCCKVKRPNLSLGIAPKCVTPLLDDSEYVGGAADFWLYYLQCEDKSGWKSGNLESVCTILEFCKGFCKLLWAPRK